MNERARARLVAAPCFLASLLVCTATLAEPLWPRTPERTGLITPNPLLASVELGLEGLYVPQQAGLSSGDTAMFGGTALWNAGPWSMVCLFGTHSVTGMWWSNVVLVSLLNEVGVRLLPIGRVSVELAYLSHRIEHQWVDKTYFAVGGVRDHGVELGAWGRALDLPWLRFDAHLFGRYFFEPNGRGSGGQEAHQYTDDETVLGVALRLELLPKGGQALRLELNELLTFRPHHDIRGTDPFTFNTIGLVEYRALLLPRFGLHARVRISSNMFVGEQPMLELKRSMIDEPTGSLLLGAYFEL
ncbi:MAG: hypothetical protein MUC50_10405 [Myxococcota bacterium]|jgi:hypothetical protein|nr:hypothetical protein [Myxococcota bacterium]